MRSSLASRSDSLALAAAMSRHPAAGARATAPAPAGAPSFATVAALLTGPWRVNDPVAFAAAMRSAPLVAGYPVVDLCACARQPTVGFDPLSAAVAGHLESAVGAAAGRSGLTVRWVAAIGGRYLFVEAAARAPADAEGPELLLLAHLVEPADVAPLPGSPPLEDDSWLLVVVGDGRGGVTGIGRAPIPGPIGAGLRRRPDWAPVTGPRPPARLGLAALRERLVGPARAAEGLGDGCGATDATEGVVLPFRR
ncbi:MAG: hypothetical protein AB1679_26740 [Actinomycetota bacterium]|jgi:hypothetical protein